MTEDVIRCSDCRRLVNVTVNRRCPSCGAAMGVRRNG